MNQIKKEKACFALMIIIVIIATIGLFFQDPIPQNINYHNFKDSRCIFCISNFWNVISNAPFFLVGLFGLLNLVKNRLKIIKDIKQSYVWFFLGITLVAFGSGYYHLEPNNNTLLWDRLPMAIAFMSLFSIIISEFISINFGKKSLLSFIIIGISSVIYWHITEQYGKGDLRPYIIIQFLPLIIIPIILIGFKSKQSKTNGYWLLLLAYIIAKVFEHFDGEVYNILGFISGHSIKHIISALGLYILLIFYKKRSE